MTGSTPSENDAAPLFDLPRDGGGTVTLSGLRGKIVALFFYPRDDTSGCTVEAREFSELAKDFAEAGALALGVSRDDVASHDRFRDKRGLTVPLLSDEDGAVCAAYGVWVEKKMYGKTFMGIERATFLIDERGIIRKAWRKVRPKGHAREVLEAITAM